MPGDEQAGADASLPEAVERVVEALLFASAEPLSLKELQDAVPEGGDVTVALRTLGERYAGRGVELRQAGKTWAFRTATDLGWLFQRSQTQARRLSRAALETLAIIAYHQPVSRAEIEEIRGVAVSRGTVNMLMDVGWVRLGRRRRSPGRPVTYVVTDAFLDHFGFENTRDLPGLQELKALGLLDMAATGLPPPAADEAAGAGEKPVEPVEEMQAFPAAGEWPEEDLQNGDEAA